jgi:uracil-DNA glycosylase family 4
MIVEYEKQKEICFNSLLLSVRQCNLCQRMFGRKKVLSAHNGNINSKVLFIAEAPGRLGAECTGIPLYGDQTGTNFETLISNIGWKRSDIFITNAILCNPQDDNGNNSTPNQIEIDNCNNYLCMTLTLINPDVVVTLGAKALSAISTISHHSYILGRDVANVLPWNNRLLFPLYHTGSRAMIHRSILQQRSDFIKLSHIVNPISGLKKRTSDEQSQIIKPVLHGNGSTSKLVDILVLILTEVNALSLFKLTKLLYLIDYSYYKIHGYTLSNCIYLRMQQGPWIPTLAATIKQYNNILFHNEFYNGKPFISVKKSSFEIQSLSQQETSFVIELSRQYKNNSDLEMKIAAYNTKPMKFILNMEKTGQNMTKTPILYQDKTVIEIFKAQQLNIE